MTTSVLKMLHSADSRYLTPDEEQRVLAYAQSLPQRMAAARLIERREKELVANALEQLRRKYPNYERHHEKAWEKGQRDMELVLRYCVQGMLLDDPDLGTEKLFVWLRTILASFNMTPGFMRDSYVLLRETIRAQAPEAYPFLEIQLDRATSVLSDFPEPAVPAV